MKEKFVNGKEAIYLLLVTKGIMNVEEITKALYNKKRNAKVPGWIGSLINDKWIKEVIKKGKYDRRYHYYKTTVKGFYDMLLKNLKEQKINLNASEKKKLLIYLRSPFFLDGIMDLYKNIDVTKEYNDLGFINEMITYLAVYNLNLYNFMKDKLGINPFKTKLAQWSKDRIPDKDVMLMITLGPVIVEKLTHLTGVRGKFMNILFETYNDKINQILHPVVK